MKRYLFLLLVVVLVLYIGDHFRRSSRPRTIHYPCDEYARSAEFDEIPDIITQLERLAPEHLVVLPRHGTGITATYMLCLETIRSLTGHKGEDPPDYWKKWWSEESNKIRLQDGPIDAEISRASRKRLDQTLAQIVTNQ